MTAAAPRNPSPTPNSPAIDPVPAPGPGTWKRDAAHFPRRCSPIASRLYETAFSEGLAEGCERYGLPLFTLAYRSVDGWMYNQPHPLGAPLGASPPPAPLVWLITRLHPAYLSRRKAARRYSELLAADVRHWRQRTMPAQVDAHRALLREDLDAHSDDELLEHVRRCLAVHEQSVRTHGRLTVAANIGFGLFVNHCVNSIGVSHGEVLRALHGDSPASTGDEWSLRELVTCLDDDAMRRLHDPSTPAATLLEELATAPAPVGPAVTTWLDVAGQRALDVYDVLQPRAIELPTLLIDRLRAAVDGDPLRAPSSMELLRRKSHDPVQFDRLLRDARASLSLRDERVLYNDYWSSGVTRRALLALGHRLVARGTLSNAHHALVATVEELQAIEPEVADRLRDRWEGWHHVPEPPQVLGRPETGDPPLGPFAEPHRTLLEATLLCLRLNFEEREPSEDGTIRGFGAAVGTVEGPARVVHSPDQFTRVQAGDIVIARSTSPAWNVILPLMTGLITDRGGLLCHAAIVARECGIPAVVGTRDATMRVPDGAYVHVDGTTGQVRILSGA
jgi:phosphohistidine swiveling domain-containing protein